MDSRKWCYEHHWRRAPSTGLVYTPPQYSDHIAVDLLLRQEAFDAAREHVCTNGGSNFKFDAKTRSCQPHAAQPSISSFFGAASQSAQSNKRRLLSSSSTIQSSPSTGLPKVAKKNSIQSFFAKS